MMTDVLFILLALPGLLVKGPYPRRGKTLLVIPEPGEKTLIHSDWYARKANEVKMDGNRLSAVPLDKNRMVTGSCTGYGVDNAFGEWFVSGP